MAGSKSKFTPGISGNPKGRPRGARNKSRQALELLMAGEAEDITRRCIDCAKEGDMVALRLCMDRIYPVRKGSPVQFTLPAIKSLGDISNAICTLLKAVSGGELSPEEGQSVAALLEVRRKSLESEDIEKRLSELETIAKKGKG